MDKRYFLMIIIIIFCCINLSIIANNSDNIGSASVSMGKYLFSAPEGFSLNENNGNSAVIKNDKNDISIYFECNLSDSDTYNKRLNYIENETNDKILSKGTITIENTTVKTVYYQNSNNDNKSAFYFEKYGDTFKIVISNFDYDTERNLTLDYATYIIKSTRFDYKSY